MPQVRHRRFRILAVATIAATLMAAPVKAETPRDVAMAERLVIPTTIEGRSSSAWAAETMALTLQQADEPTACEPDASGRVVMLAGTGLECVVTGEQMIFVPIVAKSCTIDDRLLRRAQRATGPRQDRLWSRVTAQESFMFRCLYADLQTLQGAFLAVDGLESVVDATLFIISDPITVDGTTYRWPGYYAMVEPLPPGQHLIVTGHEAIPGSPLRTATTIDVVEAPQTLLGHSAIVLTSNTCGHVLEQRQRQVAMGMDAVLGG